MNGMRVIPARVALAPIIKVHTTPNPGTILPLGAASNLAVDCDA
jgi:hypothetical protein